jgi:hypothetical protein
MTINYGTQVALELGPVTARRGLRTQRTHAYDDVAHRGHHHVVFQDSEHRDLARHHRPDGERHVPGADEVAVQLRRERSDAVGEHGEADGDGLGASGADGAGGQVGVRGERAAVVDLGAAGVVRERGHRAGVSDARSASRVALREGGVSASGPPGETESEVRRSPSSMAAVARGRSAATATATTTSAARETTAQTRHLRRDATAAALWCLHVVPAMARMLLCFLEVKCSN